MKRAYVRGVLVAIIGASLLFLPRGTSAECEGQCDTPSPGTYGGGRQVSGAIEKSGSRVFFDTGFSFIPVSLPQTIASRAITHGMISFPVNRLSLVMIIKRYELAQMIVAFHKNVRMKTITYRDTCDSHQFSDYSIFTTEMQENITDICLLGTMGRGVDAHMHDILLPTFRPWDKLTTSEMMLAIHRYFGRKSDMPRSLTRADILRFMYNHR